MNHEPYEVRHEMTGKIGCVGVGLAAILLFCIVVSFMEYELTTALVVSVGGLLFYGGFFLFFVGGAARRRGTVALRVDNTGILLGKNPRVRSETFVPWGSVGALAVYVRHGRSADGTIQRGYTPHLRLHGPGAGDQLGPVIPGSERQMLSWSVDYQRLTESVRFFAPHVRLVDVRPTQRE